MSLPLISIIIPVYNGEKYLDKLINQLVDNPYQNLEILIGNDASSDNTAKILQNYKDHKNIKFFNSPVNVGAGAIRNQLMKMATGEYLAMQDMDDLFDRFRFSKQVTFLNENKDIDVVGSNARLIDMNGVWGEIITPERPSWRRWFLQNSTVHASVMFRRKILVEDAMYSEEMRFGEDYYFLTKLYMNGARFFNLQESLYDYYIAKSELRTRAKRFFLVLIKSKYKIGQLFPWYVRPFFVASHALKLTLRSIISYLGYRNE